MDARCRHRAWIALLGLALLAACAGREARDFRGRWMPLDAWPDATMAVPLHAPHLFQATPVDKTLRSLLVRWTRDAGVELDYRHPDDFTLHQPVARIRARSLEEAVAGLGDAFADAGVAMHVQAGRVVVEPMGVASGARSVRAASPGRP